MGITDPKQHWENIYATRQADEVSWFQDKPKISLQLMDELAIPKNARIIDVGGGDSLFVDHLLSLSYSDITILDISEAALNRAKLRLGALASRVKWVQANVTEFESASRFLA